jgi:hypothetical protein
MIFRHVSDLICRHKPPAERLLKVRGGDNNACWKDAGQGAATECYELSS